MAFHAKLVNITFYNAVCFRQANTSPAAGKARRDFAQSLYAKYLKPRNDETSSHSAPAPIVVSPSILSDIESQFAKDQPLHPLLFEAAQSEVRSHHNFITDP